MNAERDHLLAAHLRKISHETDRMAELLDPPDSAEPRKATDAEVMEHVHGSKPESPEPVELGELLDVHARAVHADKVVGGVEWSRKARKTARKAIVAFVARQTADFAAENEELKAAIDMNAIFADERSAENDAERARVRTLNEENDQLKAELAEARKPESCQECEDWREHKLAYGRLANWLGDNYPDEPIRGTWAEMAIRLIQAKTPQQPTDPCKREKTALAGIVAIEEWITANVPKEVIDDARCRKTSEVAIMLLKQWKSGTTVAKFNITIDAPQTADGKTTWTEAEIQKPERQPGDYWCAVNMSQAPRPGDDACDAKRGNVLPGQKPGGVQMKLWQCKQCAELRTEPDAVETETASGKPFFVTYYVHIYEYREDGQYVADVPRLPECCSYDPLSAVDALANAKEALRTCLEGYLADGKIPWLPLEKTPPCPPGATERVVAVKIAVDTAPEPETQDAAADELSELSDGMESLIDAVTFEVGRTTENDDAIDALVKAIRKLEANQIDPTATCGGCVTWEESKSFHESSHRLCMTVDRSRAERDVACMNIQRKTPESSDSARNPSGNMEVAVESKPVGKARFFRDDTQLWVYPVGDNTGWWFSLASRRIERSITHFHGDEHESLWSRKEITEAQALAILAKADWPEGLAKLRELATTEEDCPEIKGECAKCGEDITHNKYGWQHNRGRIDHSAVPVTPGIGAAFTKGEPE